MLERVREALGVPVLTLGFDELERLPAGPVLDLVAGLARHRPPQLRTVFTSRTCTPEFDGCALIRAASLGFNAHEVEQYIAADLGSALSPADTRALALALLRETAGWPALVAARVRASADPWPATGTLVAAFGPIIDEALSHASAESRFVLSLAAIARDASREALLKLATGDVPGTPEARRRLIRLEPGVVMRCLEGLIRDGLVVAHEDRVSVLEGARPVLAARFRQQEPGGFLEANRRAAELLSARQSSLGSEVIDLFAAAEERERLAELLVNRGAGLEMDLAERGEHQRLLGWVAVLDGLPAVPSWVDVLAGLAEARSGAWDRARERLETAREKLGTERRESLSWQWQPRLAEASALVARGRGDLVDARSFLLRALDQVDQVRRRGLATDGESAELKALERRLVLTLARTTRESAGWDKTREVTKGALETLAPDSRSSVALELETTLILGALSAGEAAVMREVAERGSPLAPVAHALALLLENGQVIAAQQALRTLALESTGSACALAGIGLARLAGASTGAVTLHAAELSLALEAASSGDEALVSLIGSELHLRRSRVPSSASPSTDGWLAALALEASAPGPGRSLDAAREAYRRVGARWDEARLLVIAAAALARRVDDGDGDLDAVVKAVDGLIELATTSGFAVPWTFAGRGEIDPERRVRTLLLAGFRNGNDRTRQLCRGELEALGIDLRVVTGRASRPRGVSGTMRRPSLQSGTPFVSVTRSSTEGLTNEQYQQIVASKGPGCLVICVPDQLVLNFGRSVPLGQRRVMLPLLLHFLRNHEVAFSMLDLAREVWETAELNPTVQTKVKVAISRLRAMLGKGRAYIHTTRKDEAGDSVVAYQVAPQLPFQIIEAVPA
jgi:hypothetical protein